MAMNNSVKSCKDQIAYRLIPSKYPPITLFDDVASEDEFAALYAIQELTNPRIQNEVGNLSLVALNDIPFGISGCSYALAPFVHLGRDGGRFNDSQFGAFYCAQEVDTAIEEVSYHQVRYMNNIESCPFDVITCRGLECLFSANLHDLTSVSLDNPIYDPNSYGASQQLARELKLAGREGLQYYSVRSEKDKQICFALFSPKLIQRVVQTAHFESFYSDGKIIKFEKVSPCED